MADSGSPPHPAAISQGEEWLGLEGEAEGAEAAAAGGDPSGQSKGERETFGLVLPLSRVKKMMKAELAEGDAKQVGVDASYAVGRVTELFVEGLVTRAAVTMKADTRKSLNYKDVATAVSEWEAAEFLRDIIPAKVTVAELQALLQQQE